MTRGLYPPDTLSDDDIQTLGSLRKQIYENAAIGGLFGAGSGLVLHTTAQWARKFNLTKARLNRNTLMLSVLGSGALGMFLFATTTGKQEVYKLHPIFQVGAMPPQQQQGGDDENNNMDYSKRVLQAKEFEKIRTVRRKTMADTLQNHHGLSDSHGGNWIREEEEQQGGELYYESYNNNINNSPDMNKLKEIRVLRRRTLSDNLQKGHGLSDSHGGQWYRDGEK